MIRFIKNQEVFDDVQKRFGKITPTRKDGVFIVHDIPENEDGIAVLTSNFLNYRHATVLSTGMGVLGVKPGDCIVIGKFYGQKVDLGRGLHDKVLLISEDQIDGIWCDK